MERLPRWLSSLMLFVLLMGLSTEPAATQTAVTVQLTPTGSAVVQGTAALTEEGQGTRMNVVLTALAPGSAVRATLHGGTCATPSASSASLPLVTADTNGQVTATGSLLFRDTLPIALADTADGVHVITITAAGNIVACGQIPRLDGTDVANRLPSAGTTPLWLLAVLLVGAALLLVSGGLWLRGQAAATND